MKILIVGDVHFSTYSSILRKRGLKYSYRLENLIQSINWVEQTAAEERCEKIIYLGDFFDKAECTAEEISAIQDIRWYDRPHTFVVGNHEAGSGDLTFNTADIFNLANFSVINTPCSEMIDGLELCYLPYTLSDKVKPLSTTFNTHHKKVIFSHNDIKDYQYGNFKSTTGFSVDDIENNCDLFFNGHLHNKGCISKKIVNVGILSGLNFSEDATKYSHSICIFDTDTMKYSVKENPHAINFINCDSSEYIDVINKYKNIVISVRCKDSHELATVSDTLKCNLNVISYRVVGIQNKSGNEKITVERIEIDPIGSFIEYMNKNYSSEFLNSELSLTFERDAQ